MDVDLRLLRYFVAVAEELSFSQAATRLHIAQPSLSKQIRQLEHQLGVQLFNRTSRHVALTGAGDELLPAARELLERWTEIFGAVRAIGSAELHVLRVGFVASAANELTPEILRRFREQHPDWRVEMRQFDWEDPTAGLTRGEVDVALLRVPVVLEASYSQRTLFEEPRWVALPSNHPLAAKDVIPFTDLLDEPFVATPEESGPWRDYWLATDERGGHPVRIGAVAKRSDEWLLAIADGLGVSLTPEATARYYQRPDVTYRPVDGVSGSEVAVVWHRETVSPAARDFVQACLAAAREALEDEPAGALGA